MVFAVIELTEVDGYLERGGKLEAWQSTEDDCFWVSVVDSDKNATNCRRGKTLLDALIRLEYQFKDVAQKEEA